MTSVRYRHPLIRPIFLAFLVLGPYAVLAYMVLMPALLMLRSAWQKQPKLRWRAGVVASVILAVMVAFPSSPIFIGYDRPIDASRFGNATGYWGIVAWQLPFLNISLITATALFPLTAFAAYDTKTQRKYSGRKLTG
ncbi:hypothetical protein [Aporhodopirellula aestuarii]|uniref:Uncharacterized protein n=1 Tax=Aporhodopirellula aestuarii TaxID=2950107 RepID=A0ABT0U7K2_9BACT|nr:hypothetical protein [Aporhodopirellula aestuarii]MCM2372928.1 hypothetical protein [Aporhodopirellula aestuarii]